MNDISAILAKIKADGQQAAEAALASAREKAKAIEETYRQQAGEETARILEEAGRQAEAVRQRTASQAGIEARNARLRVRREAIDTAFGKAMERLCAMSPAEKTELYAGMAARSLAGDARLVLNREDREALGAQTVEEITRRCQAAGRPCRVTLSQETGSFRGGFILDQGSTETNCTFEVLGASVKEELESQVDQVLFG